MSKGKVYIGTSGWYYKHWRNNFYPERIRNDEQLLFYTQVFETVEVNNTFYRMPNVKTIELWRTETPSYFTFAVKGNRYLTHNKKLKDCEEPLGNFMERVTPFEEKLGPILFQLPPKWNVNADRLLEFLRQLPPHHKFAFEFRNPTWYTDEVYDVLRQFNCAFCIYHLMHHCSPLVVTASFVYIRLHGPSGKYAGRYPLETLREWAAHIRSWSSEGKAVYIYFDNDQLGYAPVNANELRELILD